MLRICSLFCCLALLAMAASAQKQTPAPEDTPVPVAGDLGLAGARCPDIGRYLNVRTAIAPSLSPDGIRVAYRTSVTGTPQVWVTETRAGASPRQITFGESVTFHEWSPEGDWIAYGVDRGGNEREGFYLISPDGARETELLPPSQSFRAWGGFSRDGRYVAFAATDPGGDDFSIYIINLKAEELRPLRIYSGKGGVYVAALNPQGTDIILTKTRGEDANDVLYLDLANVRAPLKVSHGANDPRDPVTESDQFVRAIRERGGQVEYLRWPDEGHSIRKLSNRIIAYRRIARFLATTLGAGVANCEAQ